MHLRKSENYRLIEFDECMVECCYANGSHGNGGAACMYKCRGNVTIFVSLLFPDDRRLLVTTESREKSNRLLDLFYGEASFAGVTVMFVSFFNLPEVLTVCCGPSLPWV